MAGRETQRTLAERLLRRAQERLASAGMAVHDAELSGEGEAEARARETEARWWAEALEKEALAADPFYNLGTVCCVLLPCEGGLVMIRRGKKGDDGYGMPGLPGGFQEGASAQNVWDVACREVEEETGISISKEDLRVVHADTDEYDHNVIFFEHAGLPGRFADLSATPQPDEVLEVMHVTEPIETAFPFHTRAVREWFERNPAPGGERRP